MIEISGQMSLVTKLEPVLERKKRNDMYIGWRKAVDAAIVFK